MSTGYAWALQFRDTNELCVTGALLKLQMDLEIEDRTLNLAAIEQRCKYGFTGNVLQAFIPKRRFPLWQRRTLPKPMSYKQWQQS